MSGRGLRGDRGPHTAIVLRPGDVRDVAAALSRVLIDGPRSGPGAGRVEGLHERDLALGETLTLREAGELADRIESCATRAEASEDYDVRLAETA